MSELQDITLSVMNLRHADLFSRIRAAASAGFGNIGIRLSDYENALASGHSPVQIDDILEEYDLQIKEIEFERHWIGQDQNPDYREREERLMTMAGHFGARHLNIGVFDNLPEEQIATSLTHICQRAAEQGLLAQIEFMPYTPPIDSPKAAHNLVKLTGQPNATLLLDTWHLIRTPGSEQEILEIPPEDISCVQLSDVRHRPMSDIVTESRYHRCTPGDGAGNIRGWVMSLDRAGIRTPFSVEVMSSTLDALPVTEAVGRIATGVLQVLRATA